MNVQDSVMNLNIIDGPAVVLLYALAAISIVFTLLRRPFRLTLRTALIGTLAGALVGLVTKLLLVDVLNLFGGPVSDTVTALFIVGLAVLGLTLTNMQRSGWLRKGGGLSAAVVVTLALTVAINATFGLNPTVAAFLHINTDPPVTLVAPSSIPSTQSHTQSQPLYSSWSPPADMPAHGTTGQLVDANGIPNQLSHFPARNAEVYYPPAALVKNPPALPFVLMMMGQPGDPTAKNIAAVLDTIAAQHHGLAPIVIVADQLSDPTKDPLCLDSRLGNAETYLMKDVVGWAKNHLNILQSPSAWTIAGYSNGGECANYFGAKYPALWGNILDVSGVEYVGVEQNAAVLNHIFAGNQTAYDAVKPANIMGAGRYPDTTAIYTAGEKDPALIAVQQRMSQAATVAGITSHYITIPGADHGVTALDGGLAAGFELLYPRLGLSAPHP